VKKDLSWYIPPAHHLTNFLPPLEVVLLLCALHFLQSGHGEEGFRWQTTRHSNWKVDLGIGHGDGIGRWGNDRLLRCGWNMSRLDVRCRWVRGEEGFDRIWRVGWERIGFGRRWIFR
jgi:hypothetical protein